MFDFLSGYHKELTHKLNNVGLSDSMNVIRKCQKWVIAQNCEIVKVFIAVNEASVYLKHDSKLPRLL